MHRRRRNRRDPTPASLLALAEEAGLEKEDVQEALVKGVATRSPAVRRETEKQLGAAAVKHQLQPFDCDSPDNPIVQDRVSLGATYTGSNYDLTQDDLTQHLLTIGQSGAGKTTLFYNLMDQLTVPFWAFDLKQDYRHLTTTRDDLLVLPWTELKFNPLQPPNDVPPRRWAQVFAEIFGHATALLSGSKNYLMKALIDLYQLYDLFDTVEAPYPSLHELQLMAERDKINYVRTTSDYRDRLLNRLEAMTLTAGTIFDCSKGHPINDLLQRNVVFEFDGLGNDLQNFLMEILFAYVYEYRVAQTQRGGNLRHVFFLDEGKRVFSVYKERQDASGIPAIDELTAKMREFGEGLAVADQEASKLTDSIKANTYTKVLLATGDAKQFQEITKSMHLTERQEELAAGLGIGEAIIQTGNHDPVPVTLDTYNLDKTMSDDDLREQQEAQWSQLTFEPRQTTPAFEDALQDKSPQSDSVSDTGQVLDLADGADQLLQDMVEHPLEGLSDRYDRFDNAYQGNKAKNELVKAGLVTEHQLRLPTGTQKLLDLTEEGRAYVEDQKEVEVEWPGRGGIKHRWWQHRIMDVFEDAGWAASVELFDADVYVMMDGVELVVEVAMGNNKREIEHVEKHLDTFDQVWVACNGQDVQTKLEDRLAEAGLPTEDVVFHLLHDFFDPEFIDGNS